MEHPPAAQLFIEYGSLENVLGYLHERAKNLGFEERHLALAAAMARKDHKDPELCRRCRGECCKHGGYIFHAAQLGLNGDSTDEDVLVALGHDKEIIELSLRYYAISTKSNPDGSCVHLTDNGCNIPPTDPYPQTCQDFRPCSGGYEGAENPCGIYELEQADITYSYIALQGALKSARKKLRGRR